MKISASTCLVIVTFLLTFTVSAQDLTVEQVIARHRESIGTKEKVASLKNQMILGNARFTFKGSASVLTGKVLILSEGDKNLWGMSFNSNDYPQDRFVFDGKEVKVGRPTPAVSRSLLGEFIYNNRVLLKDGLLGGTLSSSWALLNDRKAKIDVEGRKTIDGKNTVVLSYSPKGGSDLSIKMYFDEKTFHHLRTEYTFVRSASQGPSIDTSASRPSISYKLTEDFSDFTKVADSVLPKIYRITYVRTGAASDTAGQTNRDAEWSFTVTNVNFNQQLDAGSFNIDG